MRKTIILKVIFLCLSVMLSHAQVTRIDIGTTSQPLNTEVILTLAQRFQHYNRNTKHENDKFDTTIHSPKSVNILDSCDKFYIHSLEGCRTSVYRLSDYSLITTINHTFDSTNQHLFSETNYFDYQYRTKQINLNHFSGKPVESCFSHNGRYLWVTYYRRTYDLNAIDPSAVCIIDTNADTIVRVMPTAPLPKMISCSPDNRTIAITHWGDNTIALIDISSENPLEFRYIENIAIDNRLSLNFNEKDTIDRDKNCGNCLRGTVFTTDNKYLLVGKMGSNSIAIVDVDDRKYLGSIFGMKTNMRHLIISNDHLFLSINSSGFVQKADLEDFISHIKNEKRIRSYQKWQSAYVGEGARTIVADPTGRYIIAAVNNKSIIAVVRTSDMKVIAQCSADSYPVGMDISSDGKKLIVTSQGKSGGGGNSVMIYDIQYSSKKKK
ncbi:MAG: hypothetical protein JXR27_07700 [Paludibacteraceae bacterium]|nr:hypothetical protein [Paludibacteraceae bacterium]